MWPVRINKGNLEDAIFNISINAMHAMPKGGNLEIATSNVTISTIDSQILNIKQGDYVKITITDNGIGMNRDVTSHIFEPFFTTKDEKGTGLGLSQVYGFVDKSDGAIKVYSEPEKGSCFSIFLPRNLNKDDDIKEKIVESFIGNNTYDGSGKILVIDDESILRELFEMILVEHGYTVFLASESKQALSILEKEQIDLVLSDIVMPDMDGFELANIIKDKYPSIRVQLCSGFSVSINNVHNDEITSTNILHKPFTSSELLQRVKELLNN